ncbi:testis-expressed protein 47-like [Battus philenor]|uniref:testis-expressed protein 47-like n=1 Tax=Battus philenor TaxID=42288 RepID=UPI0035CF25DC
MALPDLDTTSILDIVEENFQRVGLQTYAIRMIYAGEHTVKKEEVIKLFAKTMADVNSSYCEVNVAGLLLVYDNYFVHVIEGSEDTVHRQLRFLLNLESQWLKQMEEETNKLRETTIDDSTGEPLPITLEHQDNSKVENKILKRLKMLLVYHSIQTLMFSGWRALTARPPSLVGVFDVYGPISDHMEQLRIFLEKMNKLCVLAKSDANLSFEGLSAGDPKIETLPELTLLDFLLESPHILDLRRTIHLHRRVDDYVFYFEKVWPLPTHYTPRLLYKLKIDDSFVEPLPVMPWELVKKHVDEEGKETEGEEEQSEGSSDSD